MALYTPLWASNADGRVRQRHHAPMFNHGPRGSTAMSTSPLLVPRDTRAWQLQVWASFSIAVFLCAVGLAWLPGEPLEQVFMVMGYVFCLSTAFVLADRKSVV